MKYSKILLCMMTLVCLAVQAYAQSDYLGEGSSGSTMGSSGDYLSPNMGQGAGTSPDEGLSGMLQGLDQPSGIGIKGNVGAAPIGLINNGASVYPVGEYGASVYPVGEYGAGVPRLREFVCNSMSACGMYDPARANDGAIVNLGGS